VLRFFALFAKLSLRNVNFLGYGYRHFLIVIISLDTDAKLKVLDPEESETVNTHPSVVLIPILPVFINHGDFVVPVIFMVFLKELEWKNPGRRPPTPEKEEETEQKVCLF
jgi:hypothetical protein